MLMDFSDTQKYLKEYKYELDILKQIQNDCHTLTSESYYFTLFFVQKCFKIENFVQKSLLQIKQLDFQIGLCLQKLFVASCRHGVILKKNDCTCNLYSFGSMYTVLDVTFC